MWDAVNGGLQPQPWYRNIIQAWPYPIFHKIHPHLHTAYVIRLKCVPICPWSSTSQGAQTLCISNMDVGCSQWGLAASTMTPQHHTGSDIQHFPLKFTPTCTCNTAIRMHPYANPQHLKVLKHFVFVYIQYGCGMQSMGACSLNHYTATSYRLCDTPFFLKFTPTCTCNTT
jgi:hypothetical protein